MILSRELERLPELRGFYVVRVGDEYYKAKDVFTPVKEQAYPFMLRHYARALAERLNGEVELI
jgi:hypothetical protein